MNYEFHVGDIILLDKRDATEIGWLQEFQKISRNEYAFVFHWIDGRIRSWAGKISELPENFVRIGKYDFTKKNKQIEKLTYAESYLNGYQVLTGKKLIDTINELVDAVNELRKK